MHAYSVFVNMRPLFSMPYASPVLPHTFRLCEYESIESNFPETVVFSQFALLSSSFCYTRNRTVCPVKNSCICIRVYGV